MRRALHVDCVSMWMSVDTHVLQLEPRHLVMRAVASKVFRVRTAHTSKINRAYMGGARSHAAAVAVARAPSDADTDD